MGITELQQTHEELGALDGSQGVLAVAARAIGLSFPELQCLSMPAIPPGSRQRCHLCKVEIQGMVGGADLVHFSQGAPGTRAKLWARVCQYLRTPEQCGQCLNQDPSQRGTVQTSDYYAEAPVMDVAAGLTNGALPQDPV
jgi:hypothetical protein